jgi:hypothetical protein
MLNEEENTMQQHALDHTYSPILDEYSIRGANQSTCTVYIKIINTLLSGKENYI